MTGMTEALGEAAKKIKGILNKVTAENYPRLSVQMMEIVTATVTRVEQLAEVCALELFPFPPFLFILIQTLCIVA